jgi:predicted transcriptional regulator
MTMLSFRVDDETADRTTVWADQLGVDRSELLREALRRHLAQLAGERDAEVWEQNPLTAEEGLLEEVSDWGPAEDWSDWDSDATG